MKKVLVLFAILTVSLGFALDLEERAAAFLESLASGEDFLLWEQGLRDKPNSSFKLLEGLNHLFIFGEGLPTPFEYYQPGNVSPEVVEEIASWVLSR